MIDVQAHRGPDGEGLWSTSIGATDRRLERRRSHRMASREPAVQNSQVMNS
jgi:asparagine synthetase B (glutamine-hydrolysing)